MMLKIVYLKFRSVLPYNLEIIRKNKCEIGEYAYSKATEVNKIKSLHKYLKTAPESPMILLLKHFHNRNWYKRVVQYLMNL